MKKSSRRIFIKSTTIFGMLAPLVTPVFAVDNSKLTNQKSILQPDEIENYLEIIKNELGKQWPKNRNINLVFHGHSVPSGYFKTPEVRSLQSYPYLLLKDLKELYPFAVINIILTSIGGENSQQGAIRFESQVLNHNPDVLFIDYALNDVGISLAASRTAWESMIKAALNRNCKIILLTATPDQRKDLFNTESGLQKICTQIVALSNEYQIGLVDNYTRFQKLVSSGEKITDYMSQVNHPNEKGHQVVVDGIMKYFL
jgi:acyl-CoA thioesterase I